MEGWWVASKGLGPLPRRRESALALGCGAGGRVALPLARAAAVSTGLRVPPRQPLVADLVQQQRAIWSDLVIGPRLRKRGVPA